MMDRDTREALLRMLSEDVAFDEPMSRHTALRVGGPADALATPADREQLARLLAFCNERGLPHRAIGGGFNLLVRDRGYEGVLIRLRKLRALERRGAALFAEAGVSHSRVARYCQEHGLAGLEFAAGIPGSVGGWIRMNAGIGNREMKDVVLAIEVSCSGGRGTDRIERDALDFGYRALHGLADTDFVVSALFEVAPSEPARVRAEIERLLAARERAQPLDQPSCGSIFRNPEGNFAGALIERAGLKGECVGGARISHRHANFIVNTGDATATDVLALIERARERVHASSGIDLETEVEIIGRAA